MPATRAGRGLLCEFLATAALSVDSSHRPENLAPVPAVRCLPDHRRYSEAHQAARTRNCDLGSPSPKCLVPYPQQPTAMQACSGLLLRPCGPPFASAARPSPSTSSWGVQRNTRWRIAASGQQSENGELVVTRVAETGASRKGASKVSLQTAIGAPAVGWVQVTSAHNIGTCGLVQAFTKLLGLKLTNPDEVDPATLFTQKFPAYTPALSNVQVQQDAHVLQSESFSSRSKP